MDGIAKLGDKIKSLPGQRRRAGLSRYRVTGIPDTSLSRNQAVSPLGPHLRRPFLGLGSRLCLERGYLMAPIHRWIVYLYYHSHFLSGGVQRKTELPSSQQRNFRSSSSATNHLYRLPAGRFGADSHEKLLGAQGRNCQKRTFKMRNSRSFC